MFLVKKRVRTFFMFIDEMTNNFKKNIPKAIMPSKIKLPQKY